MKWDRLTWDHRFLQMMLALYIPSLCLEWVKNLIRCALYIFHLSAHPKRAKISKLNYD